MQQPRTTQPNASTGTGTARAVGWLLLLPAVVLTVLTLAIPTVSTVTASFESGSIMPGTPTESVGFDNYEAALDAGRFLPSVWFALSLVVVPMIVAVVVAPLLAAALDRAGAWARWTARIVLSLTIVAFAPVALALAWQRDFRDDPSRITDVDNVGDTLRSTVGMMTFGVVCAVGLMIFLPVFRSGRPAWPALFTTAGLAVLGLLAVGLQLFTVPFVMTAFGPMNATRTPVGLMVVSAAQQGRLGVGAAVATMLLIVLAVLGILAVLVLILSRLRVSLEPRRATASRDSAAAVLGVVALVAIVAGIVLTSLPWFSALSGSDPEIPPGAQARTWGPAFLALVPVGVGYLAALGISGLRPLGRHSEWLLLPFAPWLFVGIGPLALEFFTSLREDGELNTTGALNPRILMSVLSMVILAVLCRGQSRHWQRQVAAGAPAGPAFFRTVVGPTLPLAGLLFVVTLFLTAQELLWPLLVSLDPDHLTVGLALSRESGSYTARDFSVAAATPVLAVVLGALALIAVQVLHLDRLRASTRDED
jgi:ABC-type sugar transport system permease subunit